MRPLFFHLFIHTEYTTKRFNQTHGRQWTSLAMVLVLPSQILDGRPTICSVSQQSDQGLEGKDQEDLNPMLLLLRVQVRFCYSFFL